MIHSMFLSFFLTLSFVLLSCGGGGGSGNTTESTGSIGVLLTDKPADPSLFSSINITVTDVELMGSDDDEGDRVDIYDGAPRTVDLLRLRTESIPFAFREDVAVGEYCKIRLTLSEIELVQTTGEVHYPRLPGNGKLDLLARDCFEVVSDQLVTIQLDIDAGNSIHVVGNNNGFNFRPVVFVDVLSDNFTGKLVRIQGEIESVDADNGELILCGNLPVYLSSDDACISVDTDESTSFFDAVSFEGDARPLSEILLPELAGTSLTVIGLLDDIDLPATSESDESSSPELLFELDALVIELGEYETLEGDVTAEADMMSFVMDVNQGSVAGSYPVSIQNPAGFNGTVIVNKTGEQVDYQSIVSGRMVSVDGVVINPVTDDDYIKAALVVVDTSSDYNNQVTGEVLSLTSHGFMLSPDVATCVTGDLMVSYDDDTNRVTVTIDDTSSMVESGGDISVGDTVSLSGECEDGVYEAENIIILDDLR